MKIFEVVKGTGTYADSLMAVGTANLLEEVSRTQTIIRDMGTHFQIESSADVSPDQWSLPSPGFYYILHKSDKEKEKPLGWVINYEDEKSRATANKISGRGKKNDTIDKILKEQDVAIRESIHPEYKMAFVLQMLAHKHGWKSDKELYRWVTKKPDEALKWVQSKFGWLKQFSINLPPISNSQFFNPVAGKGVHAAKTNYKSPCAINDEIVEPFGEWMKFRGAYVAMLPYSILRNDKKFDFKLFVIEPGEIAPKAISMLRKSLLNLNLRGGIRLDIEASLRLAEELIMHSDVVQEADEWEIILLGREPAEIIRGLRQAYFKNMGTAAALMNDAFLPLPNWFRIDSREDANAFLGIIREHIGYYENGQRKQGCLGSLDETHSGDVPILQQYRKWLTTSDKWDLLNFLAKYAVHIMERRVKDEWAKEFSTANLTILFERGYGMKEIVENQGFKNITDAIRNSTVSSFENPKSGWKGSGYETLFGMAQEWKQKIKGGVQAFVPLLSEFVQKHNWEAVHKLRKGSPPISQDDLDDIVRLIEQHGVELVGMLLLAYGYARAPKT